MLVPDVEGSDLLIFRKRCLPVHVAVARKHEDCIYIFQPKSLGETAIYRNRIGHCAIVPRCRVMLPPTLHPHRKFAQTANRWVSDAAHGDDMHSMFGICAPRQVAAETVEGGGDQVDLHRILLSRGRPGCTKGSSA